MIFLQKYGTLRLHYKMSITNRPSFVVGFFQIQANIFTLFQTFFFLNFTEPEISNPNEENKKLVTADYLGLTDGEDDEVLDYAILPFMDTSVNIKEAAKKIYFIPDGSPG